MQSPPASLPARLRTGTFAPEHLLMRMKRWVEEAWEGPGSNGQKQTAKGEESRAVRVLTHLLSDQIVKQGDHTHSQHLCALLLHQAPQDLQAPQLQELLLGIGEVSQQGAQSKQDLERHRSRRVRGHTELALPQGPEKAAGGALTTRAQLPFFVALPTTLRYSYTPEPRSGRARREVRHLQHHPEGPVQEARE